MSNFEINTIKINMTEHVIGLSKNQDHTVTGQGVLNGESFDFAVLMDGHGTDFFINLMRRQNWPAIMSAEDPWAALYKILETIEIINNTKVRTAYGMSKKESSGSTLLMMRAFAARIETISIGDSQIVVFKNDEYLYGSTPHNRKNPAEVVRIATHPGYSYSRPQQPIPSIRNASALQSIPAEYNHFADGTMLAMTQSIGHNNITGYDPERNTIVFDEDDTMDVIMGSDGLWEMILLEQSKHNTPPLTEEEQIDILQDMADLLVMNAAELVAKAEARWKKVDWQFYWDVKDFTKVVKAASFCGQYDDISVIKWSKEGTKCCEPRPTSATSTSDSTA